MNKKIKILENIQLSKESSLYMTEVKKEFKKFQQKLDKKIYENLVNSFKNSKSKILRGLCKDKQLMKYYFNEHKNLLNKTAAIKVLEAICSKN